MLSLFSKQTNDQQRFSFCKPSRCLKITDPYLRNRMKICFLAVCLMWTTSLKAASFISSYFIEVPPIDIMLTSCKGAYGITKEEKSRYSHCVDVQLGRCNRNLHSHAAAESLKVNITAERNKMVVSNTEHTHGKCSKAYSSLRYALESWVNGGGTVPLVSEVNASCTAEERKEVIASLGNINSFLTDAKSISNVYRSESETAVRLLSSYAATRAAYDREYLTNHTIHVQNVVEQFASNIDVPTLNFADLFQDLDMEFEILLSCVSPRSTEEGTCPNFEKGAQELIEKSQQVYNAHINAYTKVLEGVEKSIDAYKRSVNQAYENSKRFYEGATGIFGLIGKIPNLNWFGINWPPSGAWYKLKLGDFLPQNVIFYTSVPTFGGILGADEIWDLVKSAPLHFKDKLEAAAANASERARILKDSIEDDLRNIPNLVPNDYDPPKYVGSNTDISDIADEQIAYQGKSKKFIDDSTVALDAFGNLKQKYTEKNIVPSSSLFNISSVKNEATEVDISFENLKSPSIDFDIWFLQLSDVSNMLFLLDFAFRSYQTIRLMYKYWTVGALTIPTIDIQVTRETNNPLKMSPIMLVGRIVTNPLVGFSLLTLFTIWAVALITALYAPLYAEYVSGCVPINGSGTFVTENLYSMAYNHAYQDGSSSLVQGLDSFDLDKGKICNTMYTSSMNRQQENMALLSTLTDSHSQQVKDMDLFRRCIDSEAADSMFQDSCCSLEGYDRCILEPKETKSCPLNELLSPPTPFQKPGVYLDSNWCNMTMVDTSIEDAIFDCDKLPSCDVTCKGPHKEKLHTATKECGCTIEWYLHSIWLQVGVSLLIYALMNASRVGFLEGLARVLWKRFHSDMFAVVSTCNLQGEILKKKKIEDKADEDQYEDLSELGIILKGKLDIILIRFWRTGLFMLVFALCLNVPWIWLLVVTSNSARPEWWG